MLVAVHGQVQNYDWGKLGASSSVARLWSSATGGAIVDNKPYAELWLGTHPSGPARLAADATLLRDHLGAELPFLLKNLSVNKALSIQAHPNKTLAAQLHASAPQHYKDDNHKPEMTLALGDFQCMCGFRPIADIASCLQSVPGISVYYFQSKTISNAIIVDLFTSELRELVGERISSTFEQLVAAGASAESTEVKKALHDVFEAVMKCMLSEYVE
jgi:mannose-6-phosphate isomerase